MTISTIAMMSHSVVETRSAADSRVKPAALVGHVKNTNVPEAATLSNVRPTKI
jgi:hypothetical protein